MVARKPLPPIKSSYEQAYDGEWYQVAMNKNFDQCCDCGLVHKTSYKIVDKDGNRIAGAKLLTASWRAKRATAAVRRQFKFEKDDE